MVAKQAKLLLLSRDGREESITRVLEFAYTHTDKFSEANVYIFCVAPLARALHKANEIYQISVRCVPCRVCTTPEFKKLRDGGHSKAQRSIEILYRNRRS